MSETQIDLGEVLNMSAGVATYPQHGVERSELVRVADSALYMAKEQGKNTVRVYRPDVIELTELRRLAEGRIAPPACAPPPAWRTRSTPGTPTPAATRTWSASSPPASPVAWASTRSRSS